MPREKKGNAIILGLGLIAVLMICKSCVAENLVYKSSNITIKNNHKESADSASINLTKKLK